MQCFTMLSAGSYPDHPLLTLKIGNLVNELENSKGVNEVKSSNVQSQRNTRKKSLLQGIQENVTEAI